MKIFRAIILISCVFLYIGCDNDNDDAGTGNNNAPIGDMLKGSWTNPVTEDGYHVEYEKVKALKTNEDGLTFSSEQKLIERSNSSWCGTPPIITADYEGSWILNDSIINIEVGYWGGKVKREWKIKSIDDNHLIIERLKDAYTKER